jgi:hypothetical protein
VIPPELQPHQPDDPKPELCDFCQVHPLTLTGAMAYYQDRPVQARGMYAQADAHGLLLASTSHTFQAGAWAACAGCTPMVARRDPDVLANHVLGERVGAGQPITATDLVHLQGIYRAVLPALGPPRRME